MTTHFISRRALPAMFGAMLLLANGAAFAADALNLNYGVAVKGYDPVAYFTQHKAVKGSTDITAEHDGARYQFASEEDKKLFVANPEKYVPQYGGFCAGGTLGGHKADINPEAFAINDGKLYLNYNAKVRDSFQSDAAANVTKANHNWTEVKKQDYVYR